jgi:hypothetical protein
VSAPPGGAFAQAPGGAGGAGGAGGGAGGTLALALEDAHAAGAVCGALRPKVGGAAGGADAGAGFWDVIRRCVRAGAGGSAGGAGGAEGGPAVEWRAQAGLPPPSPPVLSGHAASLTPY